VRLSSAALGCDNAAWIGFQRRYLGCHKRERKKA